MSEDTDACAAVEKQPYTYLRKGQGTARFGRITYPKQDTNIKCPIEKSIKHYMEPEIADERTTSVLENSAVDPSLLACKEKWDLQNQRDEISLELFERHERAVASGNASATLHSVVRSPVSKYVEDSPLSNGDKNSPSHLRKLLTIDLNRSLEEIVNSGKNYAIPDANYVGENNENQLLPPLKAAEFTKPGYFGTKFLETKAPIPYYSDKMLEFPARQPLMHINYDNRNQRLPGAVEPKFTQQRMQSFSNEVGLIPHVASHEDRSPRELQLEAMIKSLQISAEALEKKIQEVQSKEQHLQEEIDRERQQLWTERDKINREREKMLMIESETTVLKHKLEESEKRRTEEVALYRRENITVQDENCDLRARLSDSRSQFSQLKKENEGVKKQLEILQEKYGSLEESNARLQAENAQLRLMKSAKQKQLQSAMSASSQTGSSSNVPKEKVPKTVRFTLPESKSPPVLSMENRGIQVSLTMDAYTQTSESVTPAQAVQQIQPSPPESAVLDNGTTKERFDNGCIRFRYGNGDTRYIWEAESEALGEAYVFAAEKKVRLRLRPPSDFETHITVKDGVVNRYFKNGTEQHLQPDGILEVVSTDGTLSSLDSEGNVTKKKADGTVIIKYAEGGQEFHTSDYVEIWSVNGDRKRRYADGIEEARYANGRVRVRDAQGKIVKDYLFQIILTRKPNKAASVSFKSKEPNGQPTHITTAPFPKLFTTDRKVEVSFF